VADRAKACAGVVAARVSHVVMACVIGTAVICCIAGLCAAKAGLDAAGNIAGLSVAVSTADLNA